MFVERIFLMRTGFHFARKCSRTPKPLRVDTMAAGHLTGTWPFRRATPRTGSQDLARDPRRDRADRPQWPLLPVRARDRVGTPRAAQEHGRQWATRRPDGAGAGRRAGAVPVDRPGRHYA